MPMDHHGCGESLLKIEANDRTFCIMTKSALGTELEMEEAAARLGFLKHF